MTRSGISRTIEKVSMFIRSSMDGIYRKHGHYHIASQQKVKKSLRTPPMLFFFYYAPSFMGRS
jgi:hypothetical protein